MTFYLDMDGVLADFDRGLRELAGIEPRSVNDARPPEYEDAMWAAIRAVPHFYLELPPMNGAMDLFRRLNSLDGVRCEILTGIPKPRRNIATAAEDKREWVRRHLSPDMKCNIVMKEEKPRFCHGPESVLIDDTQANIDAWEAMGGTGILHVSAEETLRAIAARFALTEVLP